jgi:putrescine transport system permease protein
MFTTPARLAAIVPYLWMALFFLLPFLMILKISLSQTAIAQPPYTPTFSLEAGFAGLQDLLAQLSLDNFRLILSDAIIPFWTSFLIRIYAWINILQRDGLLNDVLVGLGIVSSPLALLSTDTAMYIGMVYSYFPFMVLPLFATLAKADPALLEAAADLGCSRAKAFWLVTAPLSLPGVVAGAVLCFIPIVGEFVIPDLLAGSDEMMIGQTLWLEFFTNRDWPVASATAVMLLLALLVPLFVYDRIQRRQMEAR